MEDEKTVKQRFLDLADMDGVIDVALKPFIEKWSEPDAKAIPASNWTS